MGVESGGRPAIGYLISQYPATNHTFILREVRQLRTLGFDIRVASVRACDRPAEKLTTEEREELAQTYYIKPAGPGHALSANLAALFRAPGRYLSAVALALRLGGLDLKRLLHNLFYLAEAVVAGQWALRNGLTHIHTHFSSTVALFLPKVFPLEISMTIHGPDEFIDPAGFYLAEKIAAARFIIAISQYAQSQLMKTSTFDYWDRFEVCRLGVDPAIFAPRPERVDGGPFRVVSVGRLAPVKGHHILIGAVDRLLRAGREIEVRFAGDGPERARLEENVRRRGLQRQVIFEGALNQDRVRALYGQADCFALPSFAEGVPVVLMEAMAMEIPCVTTWITGIPELIDNGVDGFLAAPSDEEAVANAIGRLMDDPDMGRRIGAAARVKISDRYNLPRNVDNLAVILERRLSTATLRSRTLY